MAATTSQRMWLHDEGATVNVIPYTTLDAILTRENNDTNIANYGSFKSALFDPLQEKVNSNTELIESNYNTLSDRIDQLNIINSPATSTSNGLMSKEDKIKLDSIDNAGGGSSYTPQPATSDDAGVVKIGSTISVDADGTIDVKGLDTLSDVEITNASGNQVLSYDGVRSLWVNKTLSASSGVGNLDDIADISFNNLANDQILKYVMTGNGGYWTNGDMDISQASISLDLTSTEAILALFSDENNVYYMGDAYPV